MIYRRIPVTDGPESVRAAMEARGSHWFEASTMRFFQSRVAFWAHLGTDGLYRFLSSECSPGGPRRYTVRVFTPGRASIGEEGGFQGYGNRGTAERAIFRTIAKVA